MDIDNLFDYLRDGAERGRREFRLVVTENPIGGGLGFYIHPLDKTGVEMTVVLQPGGGIEGSDFQDTGYSMDWDFYPLTLEDLVDSGVPA
jgi:hypothetical protein